jgi:hypothetical protein
VTAVAAAARAPVDRFRCWNRNTHVVDVELEPLEAAALVVALLVHALLHNVEMDLIVNHF